MIELLLIVAAAMQPTARDVWLDSLDVATVQQDWGQARANRSVDNHPLSIGGRGFERGIGTHANSEWTIELAGGAAGFHAMVGVDDEPCGGAGTVVFVVLGDGKELARTPTMHLKDAASPIDVDVKGVKTLSLIVEDAGDGINYDHADWADARLTRTEGSQVVPRAAKSVQIEMAIAPASEANEPRLNYPRITGASPGKPFLFRIPASGTPPPVFTALGLPEGLRLDAENGIIGGSLAREGTWTVRILAENSMGRTAQAFTIVGRKDAIALTPPMGWNSWNCWAGAVDDAKVRAAADAFVEQRLASHGYQYVNIDDTWEGTRGEDGRIRCNEKFPDMKGLADAVHARGLKLGIYSSPGPKTCAGFEGSYQHEIEDAEQYASWGIDYLKYDWCSYGEIAPKPDREALMKPYLVMRDALRSQPRDILYSLCQYGMGNVWEWGEQVDGNCWRTTGDITDTWRSLSGIGFAQGTPAPHAKPGHWNDPDMLVVGRVGWGPSLHPSRLTHNEQITHMTLWSMLAAPLLIGCELSPMDPFTLAVLTNDDVLSVDQDPLGKQATRVWQKGQAEVWMRPLDGGGQAVAFFNRGRADADISVTTAELGITGAMTTRDAWLHKDLGPVGAEMRAKVGSHGAAMYLLHPPTSR
jgi:alpha-galactosidase